MKKIFGLIGLVVLLLVGGLGAWIYYAPIYTAKEAVKAQLNDPASAQFRNVRRLSRLTVCGEVNAKNRMGGYVGFTQFHVLMVGDKPFVAIARDSSTVFGDFDKKVTDLANNYVKEACGDGPT